MMTEELTDELTDELTEAPEVHGTASVLGVARAAKQAIWQQVFGRLCALPALQPLERRGPRRLLVGAYVVLLFGIAAAGLASSNLAVGVLMAAYLVGSVLLGVATQGLLDKPISWLDERQLHLRRTVVPEPYVTGATLGVVVGLIAAGAFEADAGGPKMLGLLVFAIGGLYGLPSMALAWKLPDPDGDPLDPGAGLGR